MTMRAAVGDTGAAHVKAEWDVSEHDRNLVSSRTPDDLPAFMPAVIANMTD